MFDCFSHGQYAKLSKRKKKTVTKHVSEVTKKVNEFSRSNLSNKTETAHTEKKY